MKAHSKLGASSYKRWRNCPASVRLSVGMPNTSSPEAQEGTYAHTLGERILNGEIRDLSDFEDEMIEAVMIYVKYVESAAVGADYYRLEERFELTAVHPDLFGTADAVILKDGILYVIDYKHGKGIPVEVEGNEQLQYYALGALLKTKKPCKSVKMVIVQPRCFHQDGPIREWTVPAVDLVEFSAQLLEDALRTEDPNAPIVPGDHCRFCPAAPVCPGLQQTALITAQAEFSPSYSYDPVMLGDVLSMIPAIESWAKAVKAFAYGEAQAGRIPPGYKLVPKRSSRKWAVGAEEFISLELGLSDDEIYKRTIKSPPQIEALLSKDDKKLLAQVVIKESSGDTLAPINDKRESSKPAIETEFTRIED